MKKKYSIKNAERIKYLEAIFWDYDISVAEALELIDHPRTSIRGVTTQNVFVKILSSCHWYTLLKLFQLERLKKDILVDEVIDRLFPQSLKDKYRYARAILY